MENTNRKMGNMHHHNIIDWASEESEASEVSDSTR